MPLLPLIPVAIVVGIGVAVARVVYKARKRDKKFIESVEASTRG